MERPKLPRLCKAPKISKPESERKTRSMTSTGQTKRQASSPAHSSGPAKRKKPTVPVPEFGPKTREATRKEEFVQRMVAGARQAIQEEENTRQMRTSSQASSVKSHIPRNTTTGETRTSRVDEQGASSSSQVPDVSREANHVRQVTPPLNITRERHLGTSIVAEQVPVSSSQDSSQLVKLHSNGSRKATAGETRTSRVDEQGASSSGEANHVRQVTPPPNITRERHLGTSIVAEQVPSQSVKSHINVPRKPATGENRTSMANERATSNSGEANHVCQVTPPLNITRERLLGTSTVAEQEPVSSSQDSSQLVKFHSNVTRKATTGEMRTSMVNEQVASSSCETNHVRRATPPPDITRERHLGTSIVAEQVPVSSSRERVPPSSGQADRLVVHRVTSPPNITHERHLGTSTVDKQVPVSYSEMLSRCDIFQRLAFSGMQTFMADEQASSSSHQTSLGVLREVNQVTPPSSAPQEVEVRSDSRQPITAKTSIGNRQVSSISRQFSLDAPRENASSSLPTFRFTVPLEVNQNKKDKVERATKSYRARFTIPEEIAYHPRDERPVGDVLRESLVNSRSVSDALENTDIQGERYVTTFYKKAQPVFVPPEVSKTVAQTQNKSFVPLKEIQRSPITPSRPGTYSQLLRSTPGSYPGQFVSRKQQPIQVPWSSKTVPSTISKEHPRLVQLLTPQAAPGSQEPDELPVFPTPTAPPQILPTLAQEVDIPIEDVAPAVQNPIPEPPRIRSVGSFVSPAPSLLTPEKNSVVQEPLKTSPSIKEEPVYDLDFHIVKHKSSPKKNKRLPEAKKLILPTRCNTNYEKWTDENCQEFILKFVESDDSGQIGIIKRLSIDSSALEALTETNDWEKLGIKYKVFCKLRSHFNKVVNVHHGLY